MFRRSQRAAITIVAPLILLATCPASAQDDLPSPNQLIREALALCSNPEQDYVLIRSKLAQAHTYLGDVVAAHTLLGPYKDDFWIQAGYQSCAGIEIELTGQFSEFPAALWRDAAEHTHWSLATAYARRGDVAKALEHVEKLPVGPTTMLQMYNRKVVDPLLARGHRDAARQVLLRWADCFERVDSIAPYRHPEVSIEHDLKRLADLGEPNRAHALCQRWQTIVEAETDIDEWGEFIGMSWARLGASWAVLKEKEKAQSALNKAREWVEVATGAGLDRTRPHRCIELGVAFAAVAARQRGVLADDVAQDTFRRAFELADLAVASDYGFYAYEQIVREQLKAGGERGVPQTIERILTARYRARAWNAVSKHYFDRRDTQQALAAAKKAAAEFDGGGLETHLAWEMAEVVESLAHAGDKDSAQQLFQRAMEFSERHEDPKFFHQWIASRQAAAGFLSEAYATIKKIPESESRILPLAELAREMAKRKASGGR